MKRCIFSMIMMLLFVFLISGTVFATETLTSIKKIEIAGIETPYVNEKIDVDATIRRGECKIKDIIWYKDGVRILGEFFEETGKHVCKIYFEPNEGYTITAKTSFVVEGVIEYENIIKAQDYNGYYVEIQYTVNEKPSAFPTLIMFTALNAPKYNQTFDYEVTSMNPNYYDCSKVEWYKNGQLLTKDTVAGSDEYVARIYFDLYNGFELTPNVKAQLDTKFVEIVQSASGMYFEKTYTVKATSDNKALSSIHISIKEAPTYGNALKKVIVKESKDSPYFNITNIEWYRNDYRMLDDYFYDGTYRCRVYFEFINGGFPTADFGIITSASNWPKKYTIINNKYYFEETFNIKKSNSSTFKFDELNIPVYGGVQDTKVNSIEPGLYTPSFVYWYKDDKYMSNIETFGEGTYKCKFSLTLNSQMSIPENLNATINGEKADAYIENNKVTIVKTYEVIKPSKMWTSASDWAVDELNDALNNALIPTILDNKNYTQNITRAEFAAVAVKMYERLALKVATPVESNPFTDTNDIEILKAYALGITTGTSATTFEPDNLITRQEMATMMVRALSKADIPVSVDLNRVNKFADHIQIESWALNGVYFMSNAGIIKGKGNNTFDVLGNATREEALALSIRSVNNYK